jgi:hypothetical protein
MSKKKETPFAVVLGGSHFLYGPFISYHETFKSVKKKIGNRDDFLILKSKDNNIIPVGKNGASYK